MPYDLEQKKKSQLEKGTVWHLFYRTE